MEQILRQPPKDLLDTILAVEAASVFDPNFSKVDERTLEYLQDLNSIYESLNPEPQKSVLAIIPCAPANMPKDFGFFYNSERYFQLENNLILYLIKENITEVWVEMSQGLATATALAVIRMKKHGFNIKLNVAVPCKGFDSQIFGMSKKIYEKIVKAADVCTLVSEKPKNNETYKNALLYIINNSDKALCANPEFKNNKFFLGHCERTKKEVLEFKIE